MASIQPLQCPQCDRYFPLGENFCLKDGTALQPLKLDGYILEEKIGEGGMGEVWSARHPEIGKQAAIKVLGRDIIKEDKATRRFLQEARAVNAVRHRNLVDIFAFGQTPDGQPYMIMELLRGETLSAYLKKKGVLPLSEILSLLGPVCSALHKTHEAGLIHRDLKPDNLFLVLEDESEPLLKILDFGLVKSAQDDDSGGMTHSGAIFGTPEYMSPEQCQKSRDVDRRTDIYALGVILSSMLTGRTPFREREDSATMVIVKQITQVPTPPSALVSGRTIPPELDAMVLQSLSKERDQRYPTMLAFFEALKKAATPYLHKAENLSMTRPLYTEGSPALLQRQASMTTPPGASPKSGYYAGATAPRPQEKSKAPLVAAGVVLVFLGSFGGYLLSLPRSAQPTATTPAAQSPTAPSPSIQAPSSMPATTAPSSAPTPRVEPVVITKTPVPEPKKAPKAKPAKDKDFAE